MFRFSTILFLSLFLVASADAQQPPIIQSGPVTPNHPLMTITNGVAGDAGTAAQGKLTGVGTTGSGPTICANSGPVTGPYNQLCLGTTQTGGGTLYLNNVGGAVGGFGLSINGIPQALGGGGVLDFTAPPHQFVNGFSNNIGLTAQPQAADIGGLGTMATQNANSVGISGGTITGMPNPAAPTDVANKAYVDTSISQSCPPFWFCVANFPDLATAVSAAVGAGGGTVYLSSSVTIASAQAIPSNINLICANNKAVVISTSSATADILLVSGTNIYIGHCGFRYSGVGFKTSGYFLNLTGTVASQGIVLHDLDLENPFVGVRIAANSVSITDITISNINSGVGAGGILCDASNLANVKGAFIGPSTSGFPEFGVKLTGVADTEGCRLAISDSLISDMQNALSLKPGGSNVVSVNAANNAFANNALDNTVIIQPAAGGTVAHVSMTNNEIDVSSTANGIFISDLGGGTILETTLTGNVIDQSFATGGSGIDLEGSLGQVSIAGNAIGRGGNMAFGFVIGRTGATNCVCSVTGNSFFGTTNGIFLNSVITHSQIFFNTLNGSSVNAGGNTTTACGNGPTCSTTVWANGS